MTWDSRSYLVVFGLLLVLGVANHGIWTRQAILDDGRRVLIDIRPSDPRSLVQGDYMQLRIDWRNFPDQKMAENQPWSGVMIVELDERGVAKFQRMGDSAPPTDNQLRLRFAGRLNGRLKFMADTFFFQEGRADRFARATYAVLRVAEDGKAVLQGVADEKGETIQ